MIIPGVLAQQGLIRSGGGGLTPPAIGAYWAEQGGYYAGISTLGHYVIVASKSSEVLRQWKTSNTDTPGTNGADINATQLRAACEAAGISAHPAMNFCAGYREGGFSDWSLPGTREISVIYANLNPNTTDANLFKVGGTQQYRNSTTHASAGDWWYWSGRTSTAATAQIYRPAAPAGLTTWPNKTESWPVRPVRIVPV